MTTIATLRQHDSAVMENLRNNMLRVAAPWKPEYVDHHPHSGGTTQISYRNSMDHAVVILDRNNEPFVLDRGLPSSSTDGIGVYIKVTHIHTSSFSSNALASVLNAVAGTLGAWSPILKSALDNLTKNPPNARGQYVSSREYFISVTSLQNNQSVFEVNSGLTVALHGKHGGLLHPDSNEYRSRAAHCNLVERTPAGRLFEIVDNHRRYAERYVYVGNDVLRVEHTVDLDREEGLYVTDVLPRGGTTSESLCHRYEFEEGFKRFGMYRTEEEARTEGNPKIIQEQKLQKAKAEQERLAREHDNTKAETDSARYTQQQFTKAVDEATEARYAALKADTEALAARQKVENEQHNAYLKQQLDNQRISLEQMTAEMQRMREQAKADIEKEKATREAASAAYVTSVKTSTETMKILPAIVAGVIAVGAAIGSAIFFWKK